MKVAVIGTSHVGAIKMGWDQVADDHPDTRLHFFAAPGRAHRRMNLRGMIYGYHSREPGPDEVVVGNDGHRTLDLSRFDHVLKVGDPGGERDLAPLWLGHDIDGLPGTGQRRRLSAAAYSDICDALVVRRMPRAPFRNWDGTQLTVLHHPVPDERCGQSTRDKMQTWARLADAPGLFHAARGRWLDLLGGAMAAVGIALFRQPEETLADNGLTRSEFSHGALDMVDDSALGTADHVHMNASYGSLVLNRLLPELMGRTPAARTEEEVT